MIMTEKWWVVVKTLIKSSLDNYVLPGTLTGTEILFVYLYQWKRDISLIAAGSLYHLLSTSYRTELNETLVAGARDCGDEACLVRAPTPENS